ncbi:MAG: hypothetical protein H0V04_08220 [Chloroflexi bacterium]|nr:hypothetical protein [Chloroflexota bacterium]
MTLEPPAKFFVNSGLVSSPTDIHHLLRPLLKQTVTYRYHRAGTLVTQGTGWVERLVAGEPAASTYFTPLSICINVDSFEHLEFETRPDQLITYTLVQGDERVVLEFAPVTRPEDAPVQESFKFPAGSPDYVQMELSALEGADTAGDTGEGGARG